MYLNKSTEYEQSHKQCVLISDRQTFLTVARGVRLLNSNLNYVHKKRFFSFLGIQICLRPTMAAINKVAYAVVLMALYSVTRVETLIKTSGQI